MRTLPYAALVLLALASCSAASPAVPVSAGQAGNGGSATTAPTTAANGTTISSGGSFNPKTGTSYNGAR